MKAILVSLSLLFSLALGSTVNISDYAYDPSGIWDLDIELPDRTEKGTMTITKDKDGNFEVVLEDGNTNESQELSEVSFDEEDNLMTGEFDADGTNVEIELNFDGDSVEGTVSAAGMELSITGEREEN